MSDSASSPHEAALLRFFLAPGSYPHAAGRVEHLQTHVSHVFLAGAFAYKVKKAVRFPFLDASTLALRKRFCDLEIRLNRRLAPDIYLGVVPVVASAGGWRLGGQGRVVEWVVKMRRLPGERMMDQLVARGKVRRRDVTAIGDQLAAFFRNAERSRAIDRFGSPPAVRELVLGNLRECEPFLGQLFSEADRQALASAYCQFLALHEPMLAERVRRRRIIDGHGDLRCENICLTEPPRVFDCVEFQPAFRCGDAVNDLSFLVMDLEFRKRADLAGVLVERYRRASRDPSLDFVLPLYKCHRALVRGKVRGLAWRQRPRTAEGRRIRELARRHFALAVGYAKALAPPRLVVVGGLIGSGKSTLARGLAEQLGAVWLRTDEIRLTQFAHAGLTGNRGTAGENFSQGLYAPRVSELVYRRLMEQAEAVVRGGGSVVCDGTFSKASGRDALRRIAARRGASFHYFECVVPKAVALWRIAGRLRAGTDLSQARPEHYDRLKAEAEPARGWPASAWTRLSDHRAPQATLRAALAILRRQWRAKAQA